MLSSILFLLFFALLDPEHVIALRLDGLLQDLVLHRSGERHDGAAGDVAHLRGIRFSRSAFDTTQKLDRLIAAAPIMGLSVSPKRA